MSNRPRVGVAVARTAVAFGVVALVWCLLVVAIGEFPLSAGLICLSAVLAFLAAITPSLACIEFGRWRAPIIWAVPVSALVGAFIGLVCFHALLQLSVAGFAAVFADGSGPQAAMRAAVAAGVSAHAEAAGSVVVWTVLAVSAVSVARADHASKVVRVIAWLAALGPLVGLGMWVRALGV